MNTDELVAAVLVSLLRQGHHAATLECLTHGDGRGTVPPNTLANVLAPIAAQLSEARESERAAVVAWLRTHSGSFRINMVADAIEAGEYLK